MPRTSNNTVSEVPFAGVSYNHKEAKAIQRVLHSKWWAAGPENEAFEAEFAKAHEVPYAICVNSGSSGLLLALRALKLLSYSEVLTSACGFPATVAPIIHCGYRPVFVDYELPSHNIDLQQVYDALPHHHGVRAAIIAHTLGSPVDVEELAKRIYIIEDCCEAVGATIKGKPVGTTGIVGVFSFYPSHQMTAFGAGGMVITKSRELAQTLRSLRDWGKTYYGGYSLSQSLTDYRVQGLDIPYYWAYTYETVGFNMKLPDACAAVGRVQLKRLSGWVQRRQENFNYLKSLLADLDDQFIRITPHPDASPSWFGYPLTLREHLPGARDRLGQWLEEHGIRHRPFFAGNILRHPPYRQYGKAEAYPVADKLMRDSLFVGVWPGLTEKDLEYMSEVIHQWQP